MEGKIDVHGFPWPDTRTDRYRAGKSFKRRVILSQTAAGQTRIRMGRVPAGPYPQAAGSGGIPA